MAPRPKVLCEPNLQQRWVKEHKRDFIFLSHSSLP